MRMRNVLTSACAVNRAAGRRKPGAYSGPGGQREIRSAVQGGAVDERGSSVRQLRAGNRTADTAPVTGADARRQAKIRVGRHGPGWLPTQTDLPECVSGKCCPSLIFAGW